MIKQSAKSILNFDKTDIKALLISYFIVNLIFLYNTLNFLWGNHDDVFINEGLKLSSGMFEGRFSQFIPPVLLTHGQILPIITNLLGLIFLTLGLWLLAKYWDIPKSVLNYVLFITFFISQPYTLSWLYFTFITLSCLLWTMLVILGLYLSSFIYKSNHKLWLVIASVLCFYLPLGGYPPVINTIFVCLAAKVTFSYLFAKETIKDLFHTHKYTILNILIAAVLFKLTLKIVSPDNVYNLETTPLNAYPAKFLETLIISYKQFILSLPFMEKGYKILLLIMTLAAFIGALIKAENIKRKTLTLLFILGTIWCASLTTFLVIPPTQYVARIDFFGLAFVYAFALALLLSFKTPLSRSLAIIFMIIIIPFNTLNDYRTQKNWQQGFNAEMQILDDILARIEEHPNFNPQNQYRFYQAGDVSLRPAYYQQKFEQNEPFLLSMPYLAMWQGAPLTQFYSPFNYLDNNTPLIVSDITPEVYNFFMHQAQPYPHKNCIWIDDSIIIVIYNNYGLEDFKNKIKTLYPQEYKQ